MLNSILFVPKSETPQFLCKIALNIHVLKFKHRINLGPRVFSDEAADEDPGKITELYYISGDCTP